MAKKLVLHKKTEHLRGAVNNVIEDFDALGVTPMWAERNTIKVVPFEGIDYAIKSFRIPHLFNQLMYRFFRKSKARRSFEHSVRLDNLGICTPFPLAYAETTTAYLFKRSYYISELVTSDCTYRELIHNPDYPERTAILKAFTAFTFRMHEQGVNFLDHSPGNTLIKRTADGYKFYIVDVNRMRFGSMDLDTRINNFARLTKEEDMIRIMASAYADLIGEDVEFITAKMLKAVASFQKNFIRRRKLKKRLKFWKQ